MNYAELCAAVEATVENTFTADDLARFARLTEQKVYQAVRLPVQQKGTIRAWEAGPFPNFDLPLDFLNPLSFALIVNGEHVYLLQKDYSYLREAYPNRNTTGLPKVYAIVDNLRIEVAPSPPLNNQYFVEFRYEAYPTSIVTVGTSWLGDNFDSVLFNGMLVEAARFLRLEKETTDQYEKMFQESLGQLVQLGVAKIRQDIYRSGQSHAAAP